MKLKDIDSQIEWIGEIPSDWHVDRLKDVCERIVGGGTPKSGIEEYYDGDIIWLTPTDFNQNNNEKFIGDSARKITELGLNSCSATMLPIGSVIMTSRASIGDVRIASQPLCTNQGFISFVPNFRLDSHFLFYVITGFLGEYYSKISSGTTYNEMSKRQAIREKIPLPPKPEQTAIAKFLDDVCSKIDRTIAIKQQQLELLEKFYHTRIHECITKGVSKNDELKFGNDTYLGNIPVHWKIDRIKDVAQINPSTPMLDEIEMVSIVPMDCVSEDGAISGISKDKFKEVDKGLNYFENGDVIVAKITPCMENGKGAFVTGLQTVVAFGSTEFFVLRPSHKILGKYLYYATFEKLYRKYAEANMRGAAGQQRVPPKFFSNSEISFPKDKDEQQEIVNYLDNLKIKTDSLRANIQSQIETLQSLRKSMIRECVTGKKQVSTEEQKSAAYA